MPSGICESDIRRAKDMGEERREELNREEYKEQEGAAALPEKTQERENAPEAEEKTEDLDLSKIFRGSQVTAHILSHRRGGKTFQKFCDLIIF